MMQKWTRPWQREDQIDNEGERPRQATVELPLRDRWGSPRKIEIWGVNGDGWGFWLSYWREKLGHEWRRG